VTHAANLVTRRAARPDVVVVGAGIVGAACALALVRESLDVLIVDASFAGSGSTAAAMGHLVVMDDSPAQLALTAYSRGLWERMADELPAGCEYEVRGTVWVADREEDLESARAKRAVYAAHGVAAAIVDASELARLEPALRPGLAGALVVPGDGVLYPPNAARWCVDRAVALGATLREQCEAVAIGRGEVQLRDADGVEETISAGAVVMAAGVDAPALVPELPIVPRKGHLVITDRYPGLCRAQLVELGYLRSAHGLDFSHYKRSTLRRRLARRMAVRKVDELDDYVAVLLDDPAEATALYQDFLIRVTGFFRDPESFEGLAARVFPSVCEGRSAKDRIRIWVPGCATGEEAYSIAMLLLEQMAELKTRPKVVVFATDIDDPAIGIARAARYPAAMLQDISPQRLDRFFTGDGVSYRIGDAVFVGDTLFAPQGGTGRCDFPGADAATQYRSIRRLYALPEATRVFLCHDYPAAGAAPQSRTTIGAEKAGNVQLDATTTEAEYVAFRTQRDAKLPVPRLLYPSLQVNIRAGRLPPPDAAGRVFLRLPLTADGA